MGKHISEKKTGELERLGQDGTDIMVLGVEAHGFEDLTLPQKRLAYHLYRAAIPGNDIAYDQSHRDAMDIKTMLESVYLHSDGMDAQLRASVHDYLKYVWIHHGQYHHHAHTKFVPTTLTPLGLRQACEYAAARKAPFPLRKGESLGQMLARLEPSVFDPDVEPIQTNQSVGEDIVASSAVNYYDPGVTQRNMDALDERWRNKLNVRFARENGLVVPQEFRIGAVYGEALEATSHFLKLALADAMGDAQRDSLALLLEYYRTGNEETFRDHMIHWLRSDETIDYLNGFIEVYLDPRGVIGQFEANASYSAGTGLIDRLADNALYFEVRMPWPDKYKRTEIGRPVAKVVNVLVETGDAGPVSPAAYNLPNYNDIRSDHGSKNVILDNIENTWSRDMLRRTVEEFFLPQYRDNMVQYARTIVRPLHVYLHEIIGHGSGRPDAKLASDPRALLGASYSTLEECRADLVGLYHISDPLLVELGAFRADERDAVVETAYISYLQGWFASIDRVTGYEVREAHNRGHHTILQYLLRGGGKGSDFGVQLETRGDDFFICIHDADRVHEGIGELLAQLQVIKSTGDAQAAEKLFTRFGTGLDREWKANVSSRRQKLQSPKLKAFVFPHLCPVMENGSIVDVTIAYDEDLTAQQLRFSRIATSRELTAD